MDGCTYGYYLVGVNALVRSLAEEFLYSLLDSGDTRRTAHEDDLVDIFRCQTGFLQSGTARSNGLLDKVVNHLLKLGTRQRLNQVCRYAVYRHNVRQVDFGRGRVGKFDFRFLCSLFQTLHSHRVFRQIGTAVLILELLNEPVDNTMVEVITAQVGITVGSLYFEDAVAQLQYGYIVCTTTAVEDHNLHILFRLVQTVSQSGCSRFVHNTAYVQTRNLTCLFGSLTLAVVEVCRYGDDSIGNLLSQVVLGGLFHLLEDDSRNLLRSVEMSVDVHTRGVVVAFYYFIRYTCYFISQAVVGLTHKTLDRIYGSCRIGNGLTLCRVSHFALAAIYKTHNRRSRTLTFRVSNYDRFVAFHHSNAGVSCS